MNGPAAAAATSTSKWQVTQRRRSRTVPCCSARRPRHRGFGLDGRLRLVGLRATIYLTHVTEGPTLSLAPAEVLTTDRLSLTPLAVNDADEMHAVLAHPELYRFTGGAAPSRHELERRYTLQCAGSPDPEVTWCNWIIRLLDRSQAVGYVQATVTGDLAAIAWLVGVPWQRQGIATEATLAMCTWLGNQGVERLVAHIHPDHEASAEVARAVGLAPTAEMDADGERIWSGAA
jgi:RimJ/RimL family protein N-acetyltransferase